jgi:hypothetical protein
VKEAIFHPEARVEMRQSIDFYEARFEGLGLRFLGAVEETTKRIVTNPEAGARLSGAFRKRIVQGFPFSVIYRVWEDCIYLVAVAHHHRRPGYWRERGDRR